MSSGLPLTPGQARNIVAKLSPMAMRHVETLGQTPRQQDLNWYWAWFATVRYDARKVDWDGSEHVERIDAEGIATAGVLPGGFYDAGRDFPLRFRRPSAQYCLPRVIVNRFTSLLFSQSTHPKIRVVGTEESQDYVHALAEACRLWTRFGQARTYGGAQGTFCVGFKIVDGVPQVEVHDPRWVTPKFKNLDTLELASIDKRWMWPEHVMGKEGEYEQVWYWTRRIVDAEKDVVWNKVPVGDGQEPDWNEHPPDQNVAHNLGECPVVWGQNTPVSDSEDGEPDCLGTFDMVEEMDALLSSTGEALKRNLDPTVIINSDLKLATLQKGSDNAIKVEKGGGASYLEGTFTGTDKGLAQAMKLRELILEVAQCVLDQESDTSKTATEARQNFASMEARCDVLREQYGQQGVVPLLEKMLRAARKLAQGTIDATGRKQIGTIKLPPREVAGEDGQKTFQPRQLPMDEDLFISLEWPPHRRPTTEEAQAAAGAVASARTANVISDERAVKYLSPFFGTEDVPAELERIRSEEKEREQQSEAKAKSAWGGGGR